MCIKTGKCKPTVCVRVCTCAEDRLRAALWCCSSRLLSWSLSFTRAWPVERPRVTASTSCMKKHRKQSFHTGTSKPQCDWQALLLVQAARAYWFRNIITPSDCVIYVIVISVIFKHDCSSPLCFRHRPFLHNGNERCVCLRGFSRVYQVKFRTQDDSNTTVNACGITLAKCLKLYSSFPVI